MVYCREYLLYFPKLYIYIYMLLNSRCRLFVMGCLNSVSIFLNSCLISEGWKLKSDHEYHCIMNSFIAQYFV